MKLEEYEGIINKMVSDPETATAGAQALLDAIKTDLATIDAANATIAEKSAKIDELRDSNTRLLISQATKMPETPDVEEGPKSFEDLVKDNIAADTEKG